MDEPDRPADMRSARMGENKRAGEAAARDFVSDTLAHARFIGRVPAAKPLLDRADAIPDSGLARLNGPGDLDVLVEKCAALRFWDREPALHRV